MSVKKVMYRHNWAPIGWIGVGLLAGWLGCGSASESKPAMPPTVVETVTIQKTSKIDQITASGSLLAIPGTVIQPEISGRITQIFFESGRVVKQGERLLEINPDNARAQLAAATSQLQLSERNFRRSQELYRSKDISKAEFEQAKANYDLDQAKVDAARAGLAQTTIVAPFTGKLGLSMVSVGGYVRVGQDLVSLQTVDPLKVDFNIPEAYQSRVAVGQKVLLRSDAYPEEHFSGRVEAVETLIDQRNRTLKVRANVPNSAGKLIPGGFVVVKLQLAERSAIMLPQVALVYDADGCYLFKVVDGKAERVKVELGAKDRDRVEIIAGVAGGDRIVIAGQMKLYPGAVVVERNSLPRKQS